MASSSGVNGIVRPVSTTYVGVNNVVRAANRRCRRIGARCIACRIITFDICHQIATAELNLWKPGGINDVSGKGNG